MSNGENVADMNKKKAYVWRLACFLSKSGTKMSGSELADHMNRNGMVSRDGTRYIPGGRGIFRLIKATYDWLHDDLGLPEEAEAVALAYVDQNGAPAYESG